MAFISAKESIKEAKRPSVQTSKNDSHFENDNSSGLEKGSLVSSWTFLHFLSIYIY